MHGLDTYDYGARGYYPAMGRFMIVDPLAEDYYETSPYAYGLNNPMRYTDPTGMSVKDTTVNLPPVEVKASRYSPIGTRAMEPVNGVGDWLSYLAFGRTYNWDPKTLGISLLGNNTYRVDYNGIIVGAQPLMGEPPIPTFTGGSIFIKGLNYVDKLKFHRVFKPQILKEAKKMLDFTRIVGKNPDIVIESGEIILKGTGEFSKQSFSTGLKAIDFFK